MNRRQCLTLLWLFPLGLLPRWGESATRVRKVIDGDTFISEGVGKIRLLGIDAPESAHGDNPVEPFGEKARQRLRELLEGQAVTLLPDVDPYDRFGRTLAYVTLVNGADVGAILLKEGLAMVYFIPPNLARLESYEKLEGEARRKGLGIWSGEGGRLLEHHQAAQGMERVRVVRGQVMSVAERGNWIFLNFGPDYRTDFTVSIRKEEWESQFVPQVRAMPFYKGKQVEVRGRIHERNGPNIQVYHPYQVRIVSGKE